MGDQSAQGSRLAVVVLTCLMFFMFAMTSDAVGSVIPVILDEFHLSLTAAGAFHYAPMTAIAVGAIGLGFLADRLGRKRTIIIGLVLYGVGSALFAVGNSFGVFVALLAVCGLGISVFKIGALALVGDVSASSAAHTSLMNLLEGCFAVGSIVGPAIVAVLTSAGWSWKWLYLIAAGICTLLAIAALLVRYPQVRSTGERAASFGQTLGMLRDPYALGFSLLIALYVGVEVAIYVWMPTFLRSGQVAAPWLVTYALTLFFVLRALGRLLGTWFLQRLSWTAVLALFGTLIFACFAISILAGATWASILLPASGLFMSVMYPTLNSKGISGFEATQQGSVAGVILFFTAFAAAAMPLAMAAASDATGSARTGFVLATGVALMLAAGLLYNHVANPAARRLQQRDQQLAADSIGHA